MKHDPKFPLLVTAATQQHLDHPAWPDVVANWKKRALYSRVLIPPSVRADERQTIFERSTDENIRLMDVVSCAIRLMNQDKHHRPCCVICDPLVLFRPDAIKIVSSGWFQSQQMSLDGGWLATGHALRDDGHGTQTFEDDCMRFFVGGWNAWQVLLGYIEPNVPFRAPLWSGYLAGMAQARIANRRYFDVTGLRAVGTAMPALEPFDPTGLSFFSPNAPEKVYPEHKAVLA